MGEVRQPARRAAALGRVIETLYDAAVDDAAWPDIATAIATAFASGSAVIKTYGTHHAAMLESVTDNLRIPASEQSWADHWHANDLWVQHSSRLPPGEVFTSQQLMPDVALERTGFYTEWLRRIEIHHMVGVVFPIGQDETGVLGVHRMRDAGAYGAADCAQLRKVLPHVRRALLLRRMLADKRVAVAAAQLAVDRVPFGVVVVGITRDVLYANRRALRLFETCPEIHATRNRFSLADATANATLDRMVREARDIATGVAHPPGAVMLVRRPDRLPVSLVVSPWRPGWDGAHAGGAAALIFLYDPESVDQVALESLRHFYGLTPTEAAIALAVGRGAAPDQIAASFGIAIGTVRTHLKSVLAKTGAGRLATLAALLAGLQIGLAAR